MSANESGAMDPKTMNATDNFATFGEKYIMKNLGHDGSTQYVKIKDGKFLSSKKIYFSSEDSSGNLPYIAHDGTKWTARISNNVFTHTSIDDGFTYQSNSIPYRGEFGNHLVFQMSHKTPLGNNHFVYNGTQNLAFNKSSKFSSSGDSQYPASNVVNGTVKTEFGSGASKTVTPDLGHTGMEPGAWWEVDLGEEYNIRVINIYSRTDCCAERKKTLKIAVSRTPFTSNSDGRFFGSTGGQSIEGLQSYTGDRIGRYVRIFLDTKTPQFLSLNEVEVFGELANDSNSGAEHLTDLLLSNRFQLKPYLNKYSGGSFTKTNDGFLKWTNDNGNTWNTKLDYAKKNLDATVGNNPYKNQASGKIKDLKFSDSGKLIGFVFVNSTYNLVPDVKAELLSNRFQMEYYLNGNLGGKFLDNQDGTLSWVNDAGGGWKVKIDYANNSLNSLNGAEEPMSFEYSAEGDLIGFIYLGQLFKKGEDFKNVFLNRTFRQEPYQNGYHEGSFSELPNGNILWTNKAGISWETKLDYANRSLDTTVGDCAYKTMPNGDVMKLQFDANNKLTGVKFMSDILKLND